MINALTKNADFPARAALSAIFIFSGIGKIGAFEGTQGYMESFGVPGMLLAPTILAELLGGIAILVGFKTRYAALVLAVFSVAAAIVFHTELGDQIQQIMFLKNIAIAGGLLLLAKNGAPAQSIEGLTNPSDA
jgi:putative oxidoreductase